MSYGFSLEATKRANDAYTGIKVSPKAGTSFAGFRKYAKNIHESLLYKREQLDEQRKELEKTYNKAVVNEKMLEAQAELDKEIADFKIGLSGVCKKISDAKREANQRFAMIPPSEEFIRLMTAIRFRDKDSISDLEWGYLVTTAGDNYQALSMIQKLAQESGRSFVMPYSPDDTIKDIEAFERIADHAIVDIAVPDNEMGHTDSMRFLIYDGSEDKPDDTQIRELIDSLDSLAGSTVPDDSIIKRLESAQQKAFDRDDVRVSAQIDAFLKVHGDELQSPSERRDSLVERAESLIQKANATKKNG